MEKARIVIHAVLVALILAAILPLAESGAESRVRVVIGVKTPSDLETIKRACPGCLVHFEILEINAIVVEVPRSIINYLSRLPFVRYIEEDKPARALGEVQWNIEMQLMSGLRTAQYTVTPPTATTRLLE